MGLGRALVTRLLDDGWQVVTDARDGQRLASAHPDHSATLTLIHGDLADAAHRAELVAAVGRLGRLDLLVHNASSLGPTPLRPLRELTESQLAGIVAVNVLAPIQLTAALAELLRDGEGVVIGISSDAAVEHYEGWGGYGLSKAALDHAMLTMAAEEGLTGYAVDPGDMRTAMHQDAFAGEDISDRPLPETVVPHLIRLIETRPAPGRLRSSEVLLPTGMPA